MAITAQPATSSLPILSSGQIISGRFEILRFIGQGGMGQVYEALDLELKARVALKTIRPEIAADAQALSRFKREVLLTRRITHPNVCRTFDIDRHTSTDGGIDSNITFLTMELLQGETLADLLRCQGRLATSDALPLVLQIIDALSAAHDAGIIHRDLKPSNVLLVRSRGGVRVVVTDFGLARAIVSDTQMSAESFATTRTGAGGFMGTLIYMAPEQFERGEATVATDIYALGLVMYEMVTGQRPFADAIPFAEAAKRLKEAAPSPKILVPGLEPTWAAAICKCLERDAVARFESVRDIEQVVRSRRGNAPVLPRTPVSTNDSTHQSFRLAKIRLPVQKRFVAILLLGCFLLALSFGLPRLIKWRSQNSLVPAGSKILVTNILNESHDPDLNGATELLRNQLAQSAFMNLMEQTQIREALDRMSQPKEADLTPRVVREIAWREGAPLVVFGTISRVAEDYRLDLKAEKVGSDPSHPKASWRFSETAANKKDFFEIVDHGATWVRRLIGEAKNEIENTDRRPEDVTTSNWEALQLYSDGQRLASLDRLDEASLLFKRAAEKDPEFAMAWMRLGDILDTIGKSGEGFAYWRKALQVSGDRRLSPREELRIKGMYASDTGDLKGAIDYFSQYSLAYPNDYLGFFYRGVPLVLSGRADEAIGALHVAEKLNPDLYYIADHLGRYNMISGNLAEVSRYTSRVRQLGHPDYANQVDGQSRALTRDYEGALLLFRSLRDAQDPFLRSVHYYLEAGVLAEQGRYNDAIGLLKTGDAADLTTGDAADRADKLIALAYLCFKRGDRDLGREAALNSVEVEPGIRRIADAGSLLARSGFISDAQRLERNLGVPDHVVASEVARLRLHGEILLAKGKCSEALPVLEKASQLDQEKGMLRDYWGNALLACGRLDEAYREFRRLRDLSPYVWHQPEFYRPGLRADLIFDYARAASWLDKAEARAAFSEYLLFRHDSDSNLGDVAEAKRWLEQWGSVTH